MGSEQISGIIMLVLGIALVAGGIISGVMKYRKHKKELDNGAFYNKNIPNKRFRK